MKFNKNKRIFLAMYTAMMSTVMLTGFASSTEAQEQSVAEAEVSTEAAEQEETLDDTRFAEGTGTDWGVSQEVIDVQSGMIENVKIAAAEAKIAYEAKLEEERRAAEEAERIAREKAEEEAAAQQAEKELLASLIFCEAGNQPYEGQVAVGAVVMNRINSSSYPDTMEEVIYQSGQFSPAMSGWLDRVRANQGYTEAAMQAAEDALAGSNPIGDCLYFSVGGYGTRIGDHLFH
ncbi:cell wall hydrolase [Ruminococcus sp. AF27-12AA]|jgi:spore germination cell wall hydrolase CwlJ-like protein|nr:cell wall hydrolase [Ruminococcus sp. AF27-3]RGG11429.1 cell wall hydrolase [Ruminococcus sp. AF27-11AA]RGG11997.1 cell wall hydrolase [Ruminococcus sp. AF27-12AA]